jgi:hypothetical protein
VSPSLLQGSLGSPIPRHYRTASTSVLVTVVEGFLPTVTITPSTPLRVNPQDRPRFTAACTLPPVPEGLRRIAFEWAAGLLIDGSGAASPVPVSGLFLTPLSQWYSVAVREYTLAPGRGYTFTLTATDVSGLRDTASLHIEVNTPPVAGRVWPTPTLGYALVTGGCVRAVGAAGMCL